MVLDVDSEIKTLPKAESVVVGSIHLSRSKRSLIVRLDGASGFCKIFDVRILLDGSVSKIPIKSHYWIAEVSK